MARIPTFWLALMAGVMVEGVLCGLAAAFGRFGPCGPANDFTAILLLIHLPGIWAGEAALPEVSSMQLPVIIAVGVGLWSAVAFVLIAIARRGGAEQTDHGVKAPVTSIDRGDLSPPDVEKLALQRVAARRRRSPGSLGRGSRQRT
jgi:hypothetical protein